MTSMLPIISMHDLQRRAKAVLENLEDYAVIQSHGKDRAFVLSPRLGHILLKSGMLEMLKEKCAKEGDSSQDSTLQEMDALIGDVLVELSKR